MMWPSSQASKILTFLLLIIFIYCAYMETLLFIRIKRYKLDIFDGFKAENATEPDSTTQNVKTLPNYEDVTWAPCTINPLCYPTVKALMVDPINHYLYGPLCALLDIPLGISKQMLFISPNMISFFHVFVAFVGAKLLTCQNLAWRRVGIILFQIRMFLDDLDGHIARERNHIKGERSEVGSLGYYVDGVCDVIGVVAMMIGVAWYLKTNPPRLGYEGTPVSTLPYHQLKEINCNEDIEKDNTTDVGISYKTKVTWHKISRVIGLFSGQMLISSLAWNRYIDIFQELLENRIEYDAMRRETAFRSNVLFFTTGVWRIVNPHSYLHLLSLAVFCDKTWCFLKTVHYAGYVCLVVAAGVSECLVVNIRGLVLNVDGL